MTINVSTIASQPSRSIAASLAPNAHWLLRIGLASVFLFHGVGKFAGRYSSRR